jgi:hypothetical protein
MVPQVPNLVAMAESLDRSSQDPLGFQVKPTSSLPQKPPFFQIHLLYKCQLEKVVALLQSIREEMVEMRLSANAQHHDTMCLIINQLIQLADIPLRTLRDATTNSVPPTVWI